MNLAFELKKILVPVDFSETSNNALKQAIFMAKAVKAELKLLYVISQAINFDTNIPTPQGEAYYERLKKALLIKFKRIASDISKENTIETDYEVRSGIVYKEICSAAEEFKADMIIMGTHGTSGVSEFFAGSNAGKVVAHAECPVITIRKKPERNGFKNIILPIRLEISSRQKVDYVVELAKISGSTVFIAGFTDEKNKSDQSKIKQYVKQVEKYLSKLNIKYKSTLIFEDNFTKEILLYAKSNKADLIAIMNENSFSLDQLLRGPYAKQFVNHSTIPILSVPVYSDPDLITYSPYLSGALPA
jgi:nucleotide-binding universal stress UspA family protein